MNQPPTPKPHAKSTPAKPLRSIAADAKASAGTPREQWACPAELAHKRVLGAGQYSAINVHVPHCPTPTFLRAHPEYLENHPFDGVAIPVRLPDTWTRKHGLVEELGYALHDLVFTAAPLDESAIADARRDLLATRWAHCTENRLWVTVRDGTTEDNDRKAPALTDSDWKIVCANIALVARLARQTRLVGLVVDTEMYTNYATGELYPFGRFDRETWRRRGREWMRAVQSEFPDISLLFFFSWGPEHEPGGWPGYENLKPFMDGILDEIREPAHIIHGWESTFWFGGRRRMPDGKMFDYPGDRKTFRDHAALIKSWRSLSANPAKYDKFVRLGMGAWMESDPWNLYPGWPSGMMEELPWSNLSLTLAYSESTVWVWSGHTDYPRTPTERNPFLWSLVNQTRRGRFPGPPAFDETFQTDPTRHGWAFDFDILDAGKVINPGFRPAFTTDTLGYAWNPKERRLCVAGTWPGGSRLAPDTVFHRQRRRFFRAIQPINPRQTTVLSARVRIPDTTAPSQPVVSIGLFHHDRYTDDHSVSIRVDSPSRLTVRIGHAGQWHERALKLPANPAASAWEIRLELAPGVVRAFAKPVGTASKPAQATLPWPAGFTTQGLDDAAVAYPDGDSEPARIEHPLPLVVERISVSRH